MLLAVGLLLSIICSLSSSSSIAAEGDGTAVDKKESFLVLLSTRNGLANRLRNIADNYALALLSKRTLLLSWSPARECNATFRDLFDTSLMILSQFRVLPMPIDSTEVMRLASDRNLSFSMIDTVSDFFLNDEQQKLLSSDIDVVLSTYEGLVSYSRRKVPCALYMTLRSKFLSNLVPLPSIRKTIASLRDHNDDFIVIGMHIRVFDEAFDWEIVPPLMNSHEAERFGVGATVGDFLQVIRALLQGEAGHRIRFFVSSNDNAAKETLKNTPDIADKIVTLTSESSENYDRATTKGQLFALTDFMALANTNLVVHTYFSSFAEEASYVHGVPLVGLWYGSQVLYNHMLLPLCGHRHYLATAADSIVNEYTEGTYDRRNLSNPYAAIYPCKLLSEFSFPNLYCR